MGRLTGRPISMRKYMARMLHPGHELRETGLRSLEKLHEDLIHTDEAACDYSGLARLWDFPRQ